jgi:hypothetical protein
LVAESGATLTTLYEVGPLTAGADPGRGRRRGPVRLQGQVRQLQRHGPIDVSSGDQVRHRLSRAGNRRINHALHMMAVTQIRYPWTDVRRYYERKRREGKTPRRRCAASLGKYRSCGGTHPPWFAGRAGRWPRCRAVVTASFSTATPGAPRPRDRR